MKSLVFLKTLIKGAKEDNIVSLANELTYKLLFSLFPFIIFIMSLLGFFNIDGYHWLNEVSDSLPPQISNVLSVFVREVIQTKSPKLLSASLLISIFSASSGFNAIIRGINISHGHEECRGFIKVRLISIMLVLIFGLSIMACIVTIIFGEHLLALLQKYYSLPIYISSALNLGGLVIALPMLLCTVSFIYKLSNCHKTRLVQVMPGAIVTVVFWLFTSKCFNIYVDNFAKFSVIYGSIGSVFLLMLWLNIISLVLLIGSEINAMLIIEYGDSVKSE